MDNNWKEAIPEDFDNESRVWIYQSDRSFILNEAIEINSMLKNFTDSWLSHGDKVKGYATLLFSQFIVLMADEKQAGVSGCSTDSSVKLIKEIEQCFQVQLFDRVSLAFVVMDKVQLIQMTQLNNAYDNGTIDPDTIYFNNTVGNKKDLLEKWLLPVKDSWLAGRLLLVNVENLTIGQSR